MKLLEVYVIKEQTAHDVMKSLKPVSINVLKNWLRMSIPTMIYSKMICSRAVKVCSNISHSFSSESVSRGIPVFMMRVPGHVFNVAITENGMYKIDLSDIQFRMPKISDDELDDDDPFGDYAAVEKALKQVSENPFSAIKIEKIDASLEDLEYEKDNVFMFDKIRTSLDKVISGNSKIAKTELDKIFMSKSNDSILNVIK